MIDTPRAKATGILKSYNCNCNCSKNIRFSGIALDVRFLPSPRLPFGGGMSLYWLGVTSDESRRRFLCLVLTKLRFARLRIVLDAWVSAWSMCPHWTQINFSPSRLSLLMWPQTEHSWLVYFGLIPSTGLPDLIANHAILENSSPQLASLIERFNF